MFKNSKLFLLLVRSPLPLMIFILLPAALILSSVLHFSLPFRVTQRLLLGNNICLLLFLTARFFYYLSGLRKKLRYGETAHPSSAALTSVIPVEQVRAELSKVGFCWNDSDSYAEKHDRGYFGTVLIYGGLFLLLFIGTWENLSQFSGTTIHGIGIPADLSKPGAYSMLSMGILASNSDLPKLEVTKQVFANSTYKKGASDITLWPKNDGKPIRTMIIGAGDPYQYKGFDIYLAKQLVDVSLSLKSSKDRNKVFYYDSVKLSPLWKKEGDYSMYGTFRTMDGYDGEAFYNPDNGTFKFSLMHEGKTVLDSEYVLYQYREKVIGDFVMSLEALGNWSEIHVVHRRHMELLWVGGIIALLGLLLRIVIRPQRVWIEAGDEGSSRVWAAGDEAKKVVR